jgi:hypothetical protein
MIWENLVKRPVLRVRTDLVKWLLAIGVNDALEMSEQKNVTYAYNSK